MARSTLDDFVLQEKLGSGSYGVVWKVVRKVDRQSYACKEVDLHGMTRKEQEECIRETQVLSSLDSEHIIKYYDSFLEKGKLFIVTEYAGNGNLHDFIKAQPNKLPEDLVWRLALQMLLGLHHMHKRKILHRDFKTLNVFLDDANNVKLGDMGVAKILSTQTAFAKTIVGTPYYLSPELCEDKPYNEKSDVWALGVTLYECCTQRHPFDADNQGALILKILRGKYPPLPSAPAPGGYSKDLVEMVKACLTLDARKRPDTDKLLSIKAIRDKAAELGMQLPAQPPSAKPVSLSLANGKSSSSASSSSGEAAARKAAASSGSAAAAGAGGIKAARPPVASSSRPRSATQPAVGAAGAASRKDKEAAQSVTDLPAGPPPAAAGRLSGGPQGVIKVSGDMDRPPVSKPPAKAPSRSPSKQKLSPVPPFVFGKDGPVAAGGNAAGPAAAVDVCIRAGESISGRGAESAGPDGTQPLHPEWSISGTRDGTLEPETSTLAASTAEPSWADAEEGSPDSPTDGPTDGPTADGTSYASQAGTRTPPDSDRSHRMQQALPLLRAECVAMVGQRAFDALHMLLRMQADGAGSCPDGSCGEGAEDAADGALRRSVLKIIPESKLGVIGLMAKLLYLEGQVSERA